MSYTDIAQSLRPHKTLIVISFVLAGVMGGAAARYPISYAVTLSIPNDEDYFSLSEIKRLKNRLPVVASKLLENEPDSDGKRILQNTVTSPQWIEKNITPIFSVTKTDAKDLVSYKENGESYYVAWLNIQEVSKDKVQAEWAVRWVAELLCKLSHARKIEKYLIDVRKEADLRLIKIHSELMAADINQEKLQQNIKMLENLRLKYPENVNDQSRLQLYFPSEQRQDVRQDGRQDEEIINSNAESLDYLPPGKQLVILESRFQQLHSKLERLDLEKKVQEIKRKTAAEELEVFSQGSIDQLFKNQNVIYEFWSKLKFDAVLNSYSPDWLRNYVVGMMNSLKITELINNSQYNNQISKLDNFNYEKKSNRIIFVSAAIAFGLLAPALLLFAPLIVSMAFSRLRA